MRPKNFIPQVFSVAPDTATQAALDAALLGFAHQTLSGVHAVLLSLASEHYFLGAGFPLAP